MDQSKVLLCEKCQEKVYLSKFSNKKTVICKKCAEIEKQLYKESLKQLLEKKCRICSKKIMVNRRNGVIVCSDCKKSEVFRQKVEQTKLKRETTNLKKYGVKNIFEDSQKLKQIFFEKHGVTNCMHLEHIKEKIKITNLERYGVENVFEDIEKINAALQQKYGCHHMKTEPVKNKVKQTFIRKYGVDNPSKCESIRQKTIKTNMERYGVPYVMLCDKIVKKCYRFTNPHKILKKLIDSSFPKNKFETEKTVQCNKKYFSVDEVDKIKKIVIFVDGSYWHADPKRYDKTKMIYGKSAEQIWQRDDYVTKTLKSNDYIVVRLWEDEIYKKPDLCKGLINVAFMTRTSRLLSSCTTTVFQRQNFDINDQRNIEILNQLRPFVQRGED